VVVVSTVENVTHAASLLNIVPFSSHLPRGLPYPPSSGNVLDYLQT